MSSRLSAHKYIANNKKTVGVMIIALALSLMTMYVICVILSSTSESFKPIMLELPKHVSYADLTGSTMGISYGDYGSNEEFNEAISRRRREIADKLKEHEGIDEVWYTQIISGIYNAVVGSQHFEIPLLAEDDIPLYLEHMRVKITDGRMPSGDGELLVNHKVLQNCKLSLGDWFMEDWYGKTFRIVGVLDGDLPVCVGMPNGYTNNGWYFVILNDEDTSDVSKLLAEQGITTGEYDDIWDSVVYGKFYKTEVTDLIDTVIMVIMAVVMVFLSISILVAYVSLMRNRVNEYCLYSSIGYSRGDIYLMMMREMGMIFGIGGLIGLALSLAACFPVIKLLIEPLGLYGKMIYPVQFFRIAAAFVMIMGILQIPMMITNMKIKTIDAIED